MRDIYIRQITAGELTAVQIAALEQDGVAGDSQTRIMEMNTVQSNKRDFAIA
ncbi:hypothetical protein D3C84_1217110 [compost metagenome]